MVSCLTAEGKHRPLECRLSSACGFCTKHHASHEGQRDTRKRLVCCTKEGRDYGAARVKGSAVHRAFDALVLQLSDEINDDVSDTEMHDTNDVRESAATGASAAAATTSATAAAQQHSTETDSLPASSLEVVEESAAAAAAAQDEHAASSQPARSTRARTAATAKPAAPLTRARRNQKLVEQIAANNSPPSPAQGRAANRLRDARGAFVPNKAQTAKKASKPKRYVCSCTALSLTPLSCNMVG